MHKRTLSTSILLIFIASCGQVTDSQSSSFSTEQLKRHSEDEFEPVVRRLYYGGVTHPLLNLPHDAERGILVYTDDNESPNVRNARRLARLVGREISGLENVDAGNHLSKEILRFYREQFGRNSYDDHAAAVNISVDVNRNLQIDPNCIKLQLTPQRGYWNN